MLDEVLVIGYGSARKGDLTSSISSVKGNVVAERSTQQLTTALQGQIAGVQVTRSSGSPGSSGSIRIHGVTTISTSDPLVIIDGVPGTLDCVISEDVETISVLKDAAAAAIYGSRAAAGVILVTTKRAKENKFSVEYNGQYAFDTPTARPTNGDVIDWMNLQNEIKYNDGAASPTSVYSPETISGWMANNAIDPIHYPNTNWIDLTLKKHTSHQMHNVSITGGVDKIRTNLSFNYMKADGYYENKSYDRYTVRMNNDWKVNNWLSAAVDVNFSQSEDITPANDDVYFRTYEASPYYTAYWEDGRMADCKDGYNPLSYLNGGTNNTKYYRLQAKAQLNINPFKGFTLTGVFAPNYMFTKAKRFLKKVDLNYEDGRTVACEWFNINSLNESRNDNHSYTTQLYANYTTDFGSKNHSFTAMAGYEGYTYEWENEGASRTNYILTNYPYLNLGPEDYQYNYGSAGHNAYQSIFGRLMYSFKNRYLIQANVRADASSRFAPDYRWGVFPSMSLGWVVSEEPWFNNKSFVNYFKFRGSIGSLGNERIGSEFPYQALMEFGNSYMYDKSTQSVTAVQNAHQTYYAFEDITWETTTSYGLGLDANLIDSRLNLNLDVYYKKTENMLLTLGFPSFAGFSAPQQNAGDMNTTGWDLSLGWSDKIGDFSYSISANISNYKSKMGYLGDKRTISGNNITEKGSYYNEWYGLQSAGLFQTQEDMLDASGKKVPVYSNSDKPGCIKYVDQNGDGVINSDDKIRLGNSLPEYLYGGNISLGWKNLDFNMSFQGIGKQLVMFDTSRVQAGRRQWGAVPSILLGNYWSTNNTPEENLKAKYPYVTFNNTSSIYAGSDFWLFNGAYMRIKNISLGYTFPQSLMNKVFIKGLRIYASVTDLPAFSKYPKGWDPELSTNSTYISTSFIFGLNVKF
ncbi:MAG: TonB-dependent receptor [Bacteroidales bacterium]|nr:TonB-dependent receptor [Bacteroidales bacterium]